MDTEFEDDGEFGFYEAECAGCDSFTRVNDVGLCSDCAGKLERDLIRERDWDYSCLAYGVPTKKREQLRQHIIKEHGAALELISPGTATKEQKGKAGSRTRNRRGC
ncbi:MAG: hypothetical protein ABSC55_23200 [Syntrophorhabdales bacterium]|jgi:hypothetical protein